MLIPTLSLTLILAASARPPPYPESLACAAVTQAASEIADEARDLAAGKAFDLALFWSFATMEAARRDGVTAAAAEADQVRERAAIKPRLAAGEASAKAALAGCLARTPGAPS